MIKRLFDLVLSSIGLVLISPLLIIIAVWIKLDDPGPVFYRGERIGRFGQPFRIFKFRSMVVDADRIGGPSTSQEDPRVTRSGRFIRRYKLDELPQLINVFLGQMSFVGPRPEVRKYVEQYTNDERIILEVRPGITDWASIWNADEGAVLSSYSDPDWAYEHIIRPTKLKLQLDYVHHHNLWIDIKLIVYTLWRIVKPSFYPRELSGYPRLMSTSEM
jgi:lipopolysaccharide/colanic/teichoic acid biosynthesis glycosyltransferase